MNQDSPLVKVARDLREIIDLSHALRGQAIHKANDHELPGGLAMVALGSVASPGEWAELIEAAEHRHSADPTEYPAVAALEDDEDWEPPLQTLLFWSEQWRSQHGYTTERRPTIETEVSFIRLSTEWAWDNEPRFEDFAADIRRARSRMENILKAGHRDIYADDVACIVCSNRLCRRMTDAGYEDEWWCANCHKHLTPAQFNLATSEAARRALGLGA